MADIAGQLGNALRDRYLLERELGRGGMATVYLARDLKHDRLVALKVLHPELAAALGPERFLREIRTTARLQHPHILPVLDSGEAAGLLWYTMPYVEGESLRGRLRREVQLPVEEAVGLAREVALALGYAHRHGVVHRDIKPENILLCDGQALVADFGVAKAVDEAGREQLTATGLALGTPAYMSPEQASGTSQANGRSDLYSLSCVLYEMLAGEPPYSGPTAQAIVAKRLSDPVPSVRRLREQVPEELDAVLHQALAKVPADRFATAGDFAAALGTGIGRSSKRKPGSARWLRPVLAAAFGLGLASVAWWTARRTTHGAFEGPPRATSIAVLPFANMSPDGANEYFSDGMTEEIMTALSKVEGLRVAARTSAFAFKGKSESVSEIGRQLRVGTVLEGSVRRAGDRLRVTAQLINVKDGYHLWANAYDRDLRDVFAVQEEIAQAIVGALRVKLSGEATAMAVRPTADLTAYDLYLKGRHAVNQRTGASLLQAMDYFEQAIARDPRFAQAYAGLADAYVLLPVYSATNPSETWPKGRAAAERALALDSTLAEAHTTLAYGNFLFDWDWRAAEQGFRRAIALNPAYATAHHWYGDYLGGRGNLEGYLQELRRAQALDPLSRQIGTEVGRALYALRRNDEAVAQLQQVLRADPEFASAHVTLGRVYIQQGRLAEAIGEFQKGVELRGRRASDVAELAYAYAVAGKRSEAQRLLAELEGRSRREYVPTLPFAIVYMGLGEDGRAFDWLERGVAEHNPDLAESIFYPRFDPLRSHPRYAPLLQALGLR